MKLTKIQRDLLARMADGLQVQLCKGGRVHEVVSGDEVPIRTMMALAARGCFCEVGMERPVRIRLRKKYRKGTTP